MTASALYLGFVRHRRLSTPAREFGHRVSFLYLDLEELPTLLGGRLVRRRPGPLRVRRSDLLGGGGGELRDLAGQVRALIAAKTGRPAADGPVRLLTHPRLFGVGFNPVSFYYSFDSRGRLDAVVAEVTNTPRGKRHCYVLRRDPELPETDALRGTQQKVLSVSPFQPMQRRHEWTASVPGETLSVEIANRPATAAAAPDFVANLELRRVGLSDLSLRRALLDGAGGARVLALIYSHALVLWLRRAPRPGPRADDVGSSR